MSHDSDSEFNEEDGSDIVDEAIVESEFDYSREELYDDDRNKMKKKKKAKARSKSKKKDEKSSKGHSKLEKIMMSN